MLEETCGGAEGGTEVRRGRRKARSCLGGTRTWLRAPWWGGGFNTRLQAFLDPGCESTALAVGSPSLFVQLRAVSKQTASLHHSAPAPPLSL